MATLRCDRRYLTLAFIAICANACYTTIAPVLPLEMDRYGISANYVSLIFLAFSVGSVSAPPLIAYHLESIGTENIIALGMVGTSVVFLCLSYSFDVNDRYQAADEEQGGHVLIVGLLTLLQLLNGVFFSSISTSYYSLATLVFAGDDSAMSWIEAGVGIGYIIGPIFSTFLYDVYGFKQAYVLISLGMITVALFARKFLLIDLMKMTTNSDGDVNISSDVESRQNDVELGGYASIETIDSHNEEPTTLSLIMTPKIFISATSITCINVSATFLEPILAKRLDSFDVGKKQIGLIFSVANIVYLPVVFLVQYLPKDRSGRHRIIAMSTFLTIIAVLLVGCNQLSLVVIGIGLTGLLPTPVWVFLLPFMQEESTITFQGAKSKRRLNDITSGMYNSFMTLGQVIGYLIDPIFGGVGFYFTTRFVAILLLLQSFLFYFFGASTRGSRYNKIKCNI